MGRSFHASRGRSWLVLVMAPAGAPASAAVLVAPLSAQESGTASARLSGGAEAPVVDTTAGGSFPGELGGGELRFTLTSDATSISQAHIHLGAADANGGVVAFLFGPADPTVDGIDVSGTITTADLIGDAEGEWAAFEEALIAGNTYVNVHTEMYGGGEVRGQIAVAVAAVIDEPAEDGDAVDDGAADAAAGGDDAGVDAGDAEAVTTPSLPATGKWRPGGRERWRRLAAGDRRHRCGGGADRAGRRVRRATARVKGCDATPLHLGRGRAVSASSRHPSLQRQARSPVRRRAGLGCPAMPDAYPIRRTCICRRGWTHPMWSEDDPTVWAVVRSWLARRVPLKA